MTVDPAPAPPPSPRARRLNRLVAALGVQRYLEIGVSRGATFFAVEAPTKIAVDPKFRFDVEASAGPGREFHAVPSDAYFADLPEATTFDLIYLDGLHLFEQTYRDLCNALAHSHSRTVILIDDTVPGSLHSAQRDIDAVTRERTQHGIREGAWHGDVYKMVFAIHDFHPSLNFVTIASGGNPQTLVWRSKGRPRAPLLDSLEAVQRLDYWRMRDLEPHMALLPEPAAFAYFEADIARLGWLAPAADSADR